MYPNVKYPKYDHVPREKWVPERIPGLIPLYHYNLHIVFDIVDITKIYIKMEEGRIQGWERVMLVMNYGNLKICPQIL